VTRPGKEEEREAFGLGGKAAQRRRQFLQQRGLDPDAPARAKGDAEAEPAEKSGRKRSTSNRPVKKAKKADRGGK
jgi:hypothetical protein